MTAFRIPSVIKTIDNPTCVAFVQFWKYWNSVRYEIIRAWSKTIEITKNYKSIDFSPKIARHLISNLAGILRDAFLSIIGCKNEVAEEKWNDKRKVTKAWNKYNWRRELFTHIWAFRHNFSKERKIYIPKCCAFSTFIDSFDDWDPFWFFERENLCLL